MRASLIQIAVNEGESVSSRRARVAELVREQAGSDLVVLPELWPVGAFAYEQFETEAEPLDGPTYEAMSKAARDAGVWLHAGSVVERAGDGSLYNTALVLSPAGELAATYRKIHRFGFDQGEAVLMSMRRFPDHGGTAGADPRHRHLLRPALPGTVPRPGRQAPPPWSSRRAGPRDAGRTGRCSTGRAPSRTSRTSWRAGWPAPTRASNRPVTAWWWTRGARSWRRPAPARRS